MAEVPAGLPGTATGAPDGNAAEAKAATQVLAVAVAANVWTVCCFLGRAVKPAQSALLRLITPAPWYPAVHVG